MLQNLLKSFLIIIKKNKSNLIENVFFRDAVINIG